MRKLTVNFKNINEESVLDLALKSQFPLNGIVERNVGGSKFLDFYSKSQKTLDRVIKVLKIDYPELDVDLSTLNVKSMKQSSGPLKPFRLINGLTVVPVNENPQRSYSHDKFALLCGQSFGIGSHETSRLCAEWIRKYARDSESFLDIGSGSGVLLLVAAKYGIQKIRGVELDQHSYNTSLKNIKINQAYNCIVSMQSLNFRKKNQRRFDLVCANLESRLQEELHLKIKSWIKPGGRLILSGMIYNNLHSVQALYPPDQFILESQKSKGEWHSMVVKRCRS